MQIELVTTNINWAKNVLQGVFNANRNEVDYWFHWDAATSGKQLQTHAPSMSATDVVSVYCGGHLLFQAKPRMQNTLSQAAGIAGAVVPMGWSFVYDNYDKCDQLYSIGLSAQGNKAVFFGMVNKLLDSTGTLGNFALEVTAVNFGHFLCPDPGKNSSCLPALPSAAVANIEATSKILGTSRLSVRIS